MNKEPKVDERGQARSLPSALFSAVRTPFLLIVGLILVLFSETFIPNLVALFNYCATPQLAG